MKIEVFYKCHKILLCDFDQAYRYVNASNVYNKGKADGTAKLHIPDMYTQGTGSGNGASKAELWLYWPQGTYKTLSIAGYYASSFYAANEYACVQILQNGAWVTLWSNSTHYTAQSCGSWDITNASGIYLNVGVYGQGQWAKLNEIYLNP